MAVILETSLGDLTLDLLTNDRPRVQRNLVAQSGDPGGTGRGGESIYKILYGDQAAYFEAEIKPRIKHTRRGLVSMVNDGNNMHGSQFFVTLADDLDYLDQQGHTVFGEVSEGEEVLDKINEIYCDKESKPYQNIRILHTIVLDDPYDDADSLQIPPDSPKPNLKDYENGRLEYDEEIDPFKGKTEAEIQAIQTEKEAKANAQILEMIGDLPDQDVAPEDNVLFVCKLNPVTTDDDLEIIFSRFGPIKSCEVIRDSKSKESLQYAFIEFEKNEHCENAYFKMDNVLIDDRRIHVDFSQSVAKVKWRGKGKGVQTFEDKKEKTEARPGSQNIYGLSYDTMSSNKSKGDKKYKREENTSRRRDKSRSRSKDRKKKSRSRSKGRYGRSRSQSKGRNKRSRSRSKDKKRSRDKRSRSRELRRSGSQELKNSRSRESGKSRSREPRRSRSRETRRSRSREPRRSRSREPKRSRSREPKRSRSRERRRSRSQEPKRSRSREPRRSRSRERRRSRSRERRRSRSQEPKRSSSREARKSRSRERYNEYSSRKTSKRYRSISRDRKQSKKRSRSRE